MRILISIFSTLESTKCSRDELFEGTIPRGVLSNSLFALSVPAAYDGNLGCLGGAMLATHQLDPRTSTSEPSTKQPTICN